MTPSLLCETVTGQTMAEVLAARQGAAAADLVELRLDGVQDVDVARALHGRTRPAIVTVRPTWEGGRFDGSEEERRGLLARALDCGAEFIDVEWQAGFAGLIASAPERVVVSSHDFTGVPRDLSSRALAMRHTGAAIVKIAVMATRLVDTLPLVEIARAGNAVVLGMGDAGLPSRLLAARFGSRWTYAGNNVAPGQIPARAMIEQYRFRHVGADTALYGVVGGNARHSLSPLMHNAAFGAAGLDAVYVPLRAADFGDFLTFADALRIRGASVTIPYKLDALQAAQAADTLTREVGAANTLRRTDGGWEATNTDVGGFLEPLETMFPGSLRGVRAAVLGAGGAARAVVVALRSRGATVTVHARRSEQAQDVAVLGAAAASLPPAPGSWDVLVNATPLGAAAMRDESPLPDGPFTGRVVYDLTYGPGESRLIREARAAGCSTLDGLPMLIAQAERQFEWWTGRRPKPGVMGEAVGIYASHNL
jgi:3-dehydroquinate dehydratase/shikimate dehydrogenase